MKIAMLAIAGTLLTGVAFAQQQTPVNTGTQSGNTKEYSGCAVPPCVSGVPTAAPGGESGSGPAALRTTPSDSPVATGAGGASGAKGSGGQNN